jgi:lipoprotein-releasing system permease protein
VIAWYALIGVMLGVATLIVVQAVMIGFREEFTDRILGANAHVSVYSMTYEDEFGRQVRVFADYAERTAALAAVPGVVQASPIVKGPVSYTHLRAHETM